MSQLKVVGEMRAEALTGEQYKREFSEMLNNSFKAYGYKSSDPASELANNIAFFVCSPNGQNHLVSEHELSGVVIGLVRKSIDDSRAKYIQLRKRFQDESPKALYEKAVDEVLNLLVTIRLGDITSNNIATQVDDYLNAMVAMRTAHGMNYHH